MYKCKFCEKEFNSKYSLGGHVSICVKNPNRRSHNEYVEIAKKSAKTIEILKQENPYKYEQKEFHITCKKCNNIFSVFTTQEKYDKGLYKAYCSRSCANSHIHSQDTKNKIANSIKIYNSTNLHNTYRQYKYKTYNCCICNNEFTMLDSRDVTGRKFCSLKCKHIFLSQTTGGYRKGSGRGKHGWYKGIYCDSTWELAFVIYHLDHNLHIERCNTPREYKFNGEKHLYYPDFVTDEGIFEIKGYITEQWKAKQEQNPDIKVLYKKDIQQYIDYVKEKYSNNIEELYDSFNKSELNLNRKYFWIHKENVETMIIPNKLEEYLNNGWVKGRL